MIIGHVGAEFDAVISLTVRGFGGQEAQVEAVVDTGFSEYLTLPNEMIEALGLLLQSAVEVELANGARIIVHVYTAVVDWDGVPRLIPVQAGDIKPLVGMEMLRGYNLSIDAVDGGAVSIIKIP